MTLPVFDIVRGSFLDGEGLRTVVFLQGCPLRCIWCHNPESQDLHASSPVRNYTCAELEELILRDRSYYDVSHGGVTFSGGEPLLHIPVLAPLVKNLWQQHIPVIFDTSGFFDYRTFAEGLLPFHPGMLYDLKIMDCRTHRQCTGQPNTVIIENLRRLTADHVPVQIRIPLIPGITATDENLYAIGQLMNVLGLKKYTLLSYNPSCRDKLMRLNRIPDAALPARTLTRAEELHCTTIVEQSLSSTS